MKGCQVKEVRFKNSNTKSNSKKETANDRKADQKQDNPSSCTTENKSEINEVELLKKEKGVDSTGREKAHTLIESKTDNDQDKIPRINDNEPNDISIVRRRKPKDDGAYIEGSVEGIKIIFTADTGATKVYKRISEECRPKLTPTVKLSGPGGDTLKELGKARFNFELDNFKVSEDLIVAEIADDGLLGVDVLQNHSLGPADILLSKGIIRLRGNEINCMQIGIQNKTRKVTVADHIDIPGYSEAVIDVFVKDGDNELDEDEIMIIVPVANLSERYSIIMGRVVVDTRNNATVKVRVKNLYPNTVSINQDAVIGQAETCTILSELFKEEYEGENGNIQSIKQIRSEHCSTVPEQAYCYSESANNSTQRHREQIPEHLCALYESSVERKIQRGEHVELEFKTSKEETEQEISNQNQNNLKTNESKCESLSTRSVVTRSKKNTDIQKHSSHTNPSTDIPVDSNFKNLQL
ncbi:hypothetical protein KUTeg_022309 [Tegillarca granosa]|uniref:Uncharacterized protein n=1 Tax=Tegillarca granosa TaxID=220873 RepID=A0ABQ9EBA6_TEGGR|nr:hypothetical protein KUTeg_022309 [Tegillarca granosa]